MYYAITKYGVATGKTLGDIRSNQFVRGTVSKGKIDRDEFNVVGPDYVVNLTDSDLEFIQDKHKLSQIMFSNFFKTDNSAKVFMILNIFLTAIILFFK